MRWATLVALSALIGCGPDAPTPDYWIDGFGIAIDPGAPAWVGSEQCDSDFRSLVVDIEGLTGHRMVGFTVVFRWSGTTCDPNTAIGCYHKGATSWIEVSTGNEYWFPSLQRSERDEARCLRDTVIAHELLHHATGLPDGPELARLTDLFPFECR